MLYHLKSVPGHFDGESYGSLGIFNGVCETFFAIRQISGGLLRVLSGLLQEQNQHSDSEDDIGNHSDGIVGTHDQSHALVGRYEVSGESCGPTAAQRTSAIVSCSGSLNFLQFYYLRTALVMVTIVVSFVLGTHGQQHYVEVVVLILTE